MVDFHFQTSLSDDEFDWFMAEVGLWQKFYKPLKKGADVRELYGNI